MSDQNNTDPQSAAKAIVNILRNFSYLARNAGLQASDFADLIHANSHSESNAVAAHTSHQNSPNTSASPNTSDVVVEGVTSPPTNNSGLVSEAANALLVMHQSPPKRHQPVTEEIAQRSETQSPPENQPLDSTLISTGIWPNGDVTYTAESSQIIADADGKGIPHFGWATCFMKKHLNKTTGEITRRWWCLGSKHCSEPGCRFVWKPKLQSQQNRFVGAPPAPDTIECPIHQDRELQYVPCTGDKGKPCKIICQWKPGVEGVIVRHVGTHNHVRPPPAKPTPQDRLAFQKRVLSSI